ncbi:MAG: nucleotidyltransferase domain-containing protein [Oscillospiraceae bacterium]|nr:nucleotidyltransferase domain-containing protein [Oscillospiraceae bacterium]
MVYTIEELRERISPIAQKYDIPAVYIFGSYARGDATDESDVDVLFKREGSKVRGLVMGALYEDLSESIGKGIDLLTEESLEQHDAQNRTPWFYESLLRERVKIYD